MSDRITGDSMGFTLKLLRGTGSTDGWKAGDPDQTRPGTEVTFADDFFALPDSYAQTLFLIGKLAAATPDISAAFVPKYVETVNLVRQGMGFPDP
jgi:hypothetical protein